MVDSIAEDAKNSLKFVWWIAVVILVGVVLGDTDAPSTSSSPDSSIDLQAIPTAIQSPTDSLSTPSQAPAVDPPEIQQDTAKYLFVTGNGVRQRSAPAITSQIIGNLNVGARVRFVSSSNGWTEIVSSLGNGWMSSNYLTDDRPIQRVLEPPQQSRQVAVPTSREIQEARSTIIRQSIASYQGSCPCPYNTDRAGRRCGGRSAWSRPGGHSPFVMIAM